MSGGKRRRGGNFIAEWFGHRIYPVVAATDQSLSDQQIGRCPFLSEVTGHHQECVKPAKSQGVCTISSLSNGYRQDWLVCPFRALNIDLLDEAANRLFRREPEQDVSIVAAPVLEDRREAARFRSEIRAGSIGVVYFQNRLGGEVSISATERSPELSFDATMVEVLDDGQDGLRLGRYGIFEIQTMDFHGTYAAAVSNLKNALHLHRTDFAAAISEHSEWLSERVEGPNIANVFKRTFYQMMFKFQIGAHGRSAGYVLAIPQAVWDSWQRHLGKPDLVGHGDGTWRLAIPGVQTDDGPPAWIFVFDLDASTNTSPNDIRLTTVIGTDAASLSYYALDIAPTAALAEGGSVDKLLDTIRIRLARYLPELTT